MLTTDLHAYIHRLLDDLYLYFILLILFKQASYFPRFTMFITQYVQRCLRGRSGYKTLLLVWATSTLGSYVSSHSLLMSSGLPSGQTWKSCHRSFLDVNFGHQVHHFLSTHNEVPSELCL